MNKHQNYNKLIFKIKNINKKDTLLGNIFPFLHEELEDILLLLAQVGIHCLVMLLYLFL